MRHSAALVLIFFISALDAQHGGRRKAVHFDNTRGDDFNFGDPVPPAKMRVPESKVFQSHAQTHKSQVNKNLGVTPVQHRVLPGQVIFQHPKQQSTQHPKQQQHHHHHQQQTRLQQTSQQKVYFPPQQDGVFIPTQPPVVDNDEDFIIEAPNLNRNLQQVGPTPELIADLSPNRFWLPQNAPITNRFQGPGNPYYRGVPGQEFSPIPNVEAASPQLFPITGPRDVVDQVIVDPIDPADLDVINLTPQVPLETEPPLNQPELRRITPLQPAVTDPFNPEVTNNNGPFFPGQPTTSGPFIAEPPAQQLFAQPLNDGPYVVEPVRDLIVFFDPNSGNIFVYDPIRDFIRLYNPETDPMLLDDTQQAALGGTTLQQLQQQQSSPQMTVFNPNNPSGGVMKSMNGAGGNNKLQKPRFWIMTQRGRNDKQALEKNGSAQPQLKSILKKPTADQEIPMNINAGSVLTKQLLQRPTEATINPNTHQLYRQQAQQKTIPQGQPVQQVIAHPNMGTIYKRNPVLNQAVSVAESGSFVNNNLFATSHAQSHQSNSEAEAEVLSQSTTQEVKEQPIEIQSKQQQKPVKAASPAVPRNQTITKSKKPAESGGKIVKLVYSPIVEVPIGSRYKGFGVNSAQTVKVPTMALTLTVILFTFILSFSI